METNLQNDPPQTSYNPPPTTVTIQELQYHLEGLRSLFVFALIALIGMTVTVDLCFIRRQMVAAESQLQEQRPRVIEKVAAFKKRTEPLVKNFAIAMQSYAASNQDFQPIFNRYRLVLSPYLPSAPGGTTPSTSVPAAQQPSK